MANPQKENGYTAISNELFDAIIRFRIPGEVRQVFDAIIRKTYGFNKKEDAIANSQIVEATGRQKQNVSRSLAILVDHRLVIKSDDKTGNGHILKINKDFEQWIGFGIRTDDKKKKRKASSKLIKKSSKPITKVIRSDDKLSSEVVDTKDKTILKDTIQKTGDKSPTPKENAERFFTGVLALVKGEKVEWLQILLSNMHAKNGHVTKQALWNEIRNFCAYWTERNSMGTREKWQMQKTFEVDRRLATWFHRAGFRQFSAGGFQKSKGKEIIGLE